MSHVWIPLIGVAAVGLASAITAAVSWFARNPRPKYAPGQPPGGWPPPAAICLSQDAEKAQRVWEADDPRLIGTDDADQRLNEDAGSGWSSINNKAAAVSDNRFAVAGCVVMIVDPSDKDWARTLRNHVISILKASPVLREHLSPPLPKMTDQSPLYLTPVWEHDLDLELDRHMHRVAMPADGRGRGLDDFVDAIAQSPLDRTRPLWELWIIEGLANDKVALALKIDPVIVRELGGVQEIFQITTESADGAGAGYLAGARLERAYFHVKTPRRSEFAFGDNLTQIVADSPSW